MNIRYRSMVDNGIYYSLCGMMISNILSSIFTRHLFTLMAVLVIIRLAVWKFSGLRTNLNRQSIILAGLLMLLAGSIFIAAINGGHWFDVTFGGGNIFSHTVWGAVLILVVGKFIDTQKRLYTLLTLAITGLVINDIFVYKQHYDEMSRAIGFYWNPNVLASILTVPVPILFVGIMKFWRNVPYRIVLSVIFIMTVLALLFTQSRGAWLAVFGAIILLLPATRANYRKPLLKLLLCGIVAVILAVPMTNNLNRLSSIGDMQEQTHTERILTMKAGWEMFLDHPIFGVGVDNWGKEYHTKYISAEAKEPHLTTSHNNIIQILSECGLVGFIAYAAVITYILAWAWRRRENLASVAIIGMTVVVLLHGMVDCIYFMWPTMRWYWMFLAVLMQLTNLDKTIGREDLE